MSAILMMCMGLLQSGDHVVCSQSMFGSTIKLIGSDLAKFGVLSSFVSQTDVDAWRAAVRPNTKLLFAETPTNPLTEVCDIAALADIAHTAGALLAVDNCFATPALQRPVELGADIIMHSGTKFLDGQGRVMAGALCASQQMVTEKFLPVLKSGGMTLAPFNAWVVLKGWRPLGIRMRAQSAQALALGPVAGKPPHRGPRFLPRACKPSPASSGHGATGRAGWCGAVVRRQGQRPRGCAHAGLPRAGCHAGHLPGHQSG
jgi:O-succinylhomoserine sulfhydrylase